jgi:uncharacterized protein
MSDPTDGPTNGPTNDRGAADAGADRMAVAFARVLRGAGLDVPVGSTVTFARALAAVGLGRQRDVYWAGRATLVRDRDQVGAFDRAFAAFWTRRADSALPPTEREPITVAIGLDASEAPGAGLAVEPAAGGGPVLAVRWSPADLLRHRDFASYTPAEFAEAHRLMADLRMTGAMRRSRRRRPSAHRRGRPDLRRTMRRALRAGGEPIVRAFAEPSTRARRLVLICDVSGSMEPYARAMLRFAHAAVAGRQRVEAFTLGTRLTRVTRDLSTRDPDAALEAAARRVDDWSGGTRLGEGLRAFNDRWGVSGLARGAVVVILSDGWDRGDPEELGAQMTRLRRVAAKIVWVNPLKATAGYAPLARGMAAALPHVDEFVEGHSLASLEALVKVVAT